MLLCTCASVLLRLPEVGSSMKTMEGLATSSTAIVNLLRCSTLSPARLAPATHSCQFGS